MDQYNYMTFKSVSYAMKVEVVLKNCNIKYKIIPVPRSISSSCGLCVRFSKEDMETIKNVIIQKSLIYDNIYMDI